MDSFYAGKPGVSFVLKGYFKYISQDSPAYIRKKEEINSLDIPEEEKTALLEQLNKDTMLFCFNDVNYKDIWYNEFCIINTPNPNDKDNGKIFRRTLKGPSDEKHVGGVAEYHGKIAGPMGQMPSLEIGSVEKTKDDWFRQNVDADDYIKYYQNPYTVRYDKDELASLYTFNADNNSNIKFIPGNTKITEGGIEKYVNKIKYNWYQFSDGYSDSENQQLAEIHMGFDIPYYVTTLESGRALNYTLPPLIEEDGDTEGEKAPFYDKNILHVPRGITGGYINNIQRYVYDNTEVKIYNPSAIKYEALEDRYYFDDEDVIEIEENAEIWVGQFHWNTPAGVDTQMPQLIYLGHTKDVRNIIFDNDGTFTIEYTNNDSDIWENKVNWITNVEIDENSNLIINTNNDNIEDIDYNLHLIKNIELSQDGTITVTFTDDTLEHPSKKIFNQVIKWIKSVEVDNDHNLIIYTNQDAAEHPTIDVNLKTITNVELQGDATPSNQNHDNKIHITYSNEVTDIIGDDINYVQEVYLSVPGDMKPGLRDNEETSSHEGYHLFVLFNAASHRQPAGTTNWVDLLGNGLMWKDYGRIKSTDQGVLLKTKVKVQANTLPGIIAELMEIYPNGLPGTDAGKLVAVEASDLNTYLMAYDYNINPELNTWFSVGTLSTAVRDATIDGGVPIQTDNASVILIPRDDIPSYTPFMSTPWKIGGTKPDDPDGPDGSIRLATLTEAEGADMTRQVWEDND